VSIRLVEIGPTDPKAISEPKSAETVLGSHFEHDIHDRRDALASRSTARIT
jgi:hypothetical protein